MARTLFEREKAAHLCSARALGRLRDLQSVTEVALASDSLDGLLSALLSRVREVFAADSAAVLLCGDDVRTLRVAAALGVAAELLSEDAVPEGTLFASCAPGELLHIDDVTVAGPSPNAQGALRSLLNVPLRANGAVIGMLHIGSRRPRHFAGDMVAQLELIADRVGVAVQHARLHEAVSERARQQEAVAAFGLRALGRAEVEALFSDAVRVVTETLGTDLAGVMELLPDGRSLRPRASVGWEDAMNVIVDAGPGTRGGHTLERGEPTIIEDLERDRRFPDNPHLLRKGVRSGMTVPIRGNGRPFGLLGAYTRKPRKFSRDDVFFLQAIANVLAETMRRQRAEEALRESEERFRATFDHAPTGVAHVAVDGRWLLVNPRLCELLGYTPEELLDLRFQDITYPEDHAADAVQVERLLAGATEKFALEKRYVRKDGSLVWVEVQVSLLREPSGRPKYFIAVILDISERRAMEAALRRERDFISTLLDTMGGLVMAVDREGRIVRFNRACERMTGYRAEEVLGKSYEFLIAEDERERVQETFFRLLHRESQSKQENDWVTRDGCRRRITWSNTTFNGPDGTVEHVVATGIDVTEQRQAEAQRARLYQEAQDAVRLRDEFLSIASHELKTPLTPVELQVQSILRTLRRDPSALTPERLTGKMETIGRQIERLTGLVNDLLDISRITAGRFGLVLEEVDLAAVARDVAARFRYELARAGCALHLSAAGPVRGRWDRSRLDQVVTNLVSNAIKYGSNKPIDLIVEGDEQTARVLVRDRGIGIATEHQARIFDRFERAVPDRNYGGFGLGLWIVKQIVDSFGGTIRVESELGRGATFVVELPRQAAGHRADAA